MKFQNILLSLSLLLTALSSVTIQSAVNKDLHQEKTGDSLFAHQIKSVERNLAELSTSKSARCDCLRSRLTETLTWLKAFEAKITQDRAERAQSANVNSKARRGKKRDCGSCPTIPFCLGNGLPQSNPNAIPNSDGSYGSFVISSPGNYVLRKSSQMQISGAVYTPNRWQDANAAIVIKSSDVDLDLCGHTITGSGNLTKQYFVDNGVPVPNVPGGIQNDVRVDATIGILVNPDFDDLSNISIHNGKLEYHMTSLLHWNVSDFRVHDMRIENNGSVTAVQNVPPFDFFPNALVGQFGSNITYDRIQFLNSRSADMSLTFVRNAVCTNFESTGSRGNTQAFTTDVYFGDPEWVEFGSFAASLVMFFNDNTTFDNIVIRDVKSLLSVFGIYVSFGSDSRITNCLVSDLEQHAVDTTRFVENLNQGFFEVRAYAIEFVNGTTLVENCGAENINMRIQRAFDKAANGISPNDTQTYNVCCGTQSTILRNCYASNISTAGNVTYAVPFNGESVFPNVAKGFDQQETLVEDMIVSLQNCRSVSVNGGFGAEPAMKSRGLGFALANADLLSCTAVDCIGNSESAGFEIRSNGSLTNCQSSASPLSRNAGELSQGFRTVGADNTILRECTARNHTLNGFEFTDNSADALVVDCIANGNSLSGFAVSGSAISLENNIAKHNKEYGFHVNGTSATVIGNNATQNSLGGFLDDSIGGAQANGNLYTLNKAYNNGGENYGIDYVVPANPTVLQTGTINPAVFPVTTGEANVSITVS